MAAVRRGADVGAHRYVRRDGVEARLVDAAADGRVLLHQCTVTVAPLGGELVDC